MNSLIIIENTKESDTIRKQLLAGVKMDDLLSFIDNTVKKYQAKNFIWGVVFGSLLVLIFLVLIILFDARFFDQGFLAGNSRLQGILTTIEAPLIWFACVAKKNMSVAFKMEEKYRHKQEVLIFYSNLINNDEIVLSKDQRDKIFVLLLLSIDDCPIESLLKKSETSYRNKFIDAL